MKPPFLYLLLLGATSLLLGCLGNKTKLDASGYPAEVGQIIVESCATKGCHNQQSAAAAAGLNLETWDDLFKGSRGGSPVIPYSPDLSYLLFSVNTDSTLGSTLEPTMPVNEDPLTAQQYATLWNWIYDGAPHASGATPFPADPNRKKWYVGHQICDQVAIFDAETQQIMRYVDVGDDPISVEFVFDIKISPDGKDWFVVFFADKNYISRYSSTTDEKVADITLGNIGWSTIAFSPDGRFAFVGNAYLWLMRVIDLQTNEVVGPLTSFDFETRNPAVHPLRQQVYLAEFKDKSLIVVDYDANGLIQNERRIDLVQGQAPAIPGDLHPFETLFLPDGSKYFVSCTNSKEVRVLDGQTDSLLKVISLPAIPSKLAYSAQTDQLFVSCMDDLVTWEGDPTKRGSVVVIDPQTLTVKKTIYSGFQPYAIAVDEVNEVLVVSNRNSDISGPLPHHVTFCGGRNGYVSLIDLTSLEVVPNFKPETLADPSTVAIK